MFVCWVLRKVREIKSQLDAYACEPRKFFFLLPSAMKIKMSGTELAFPKCRGCSGIAVGFVRLNFQGPWPFLVWGSAGWGAGAAFPASVFL